MKKNILGKEKSFVVVHGNAPFVVTFDNTTSVVQWSSEPFAVPYKKPYSRRLNGIHRYYPDFLIELENGRKLLLEIKPKHETLPPVRRKNQKRKTFARQKLTFLVNQAKWKSARAFCAKNGLEFQVWTEDHIKSLGIKIVSGTTKRKTTAKKKKTAKKP